jgi:plasmid stabilization system protein ParE
MRLEWSVFAMADRDTIFDYIEADSPRAAAMVDDRIRQQVETLMQFPEIGRPGRIEGTRGVGCPAYALHCGLPYCRGNGADLARTPWSAAMAR